MPGRGGHRVAGGHAHAILARDHEVSHGRPRARARRGAGARARPSTARRPLLTADFMVAGQPVAVQAPAMVRLARDVPELTAGEGPGLGTNVASRVARHRTADQWRTCVQPWPGRGQLRPAEARRARIVAWTRSSAALRLQHR